MCHICRFQQGIYDCVPKLNLFIRMGSGVTMLLALAAMYKSTNSILGSTIITATIGVRQGSPN